EAKSAVARPQQRKFLGFSFTVGPEVKRRIAPKALDRFQQPIREITRRAKSVSLKTTMEELAPYMRGWRSYFGFCETPGVLVRIPGEDEQDSGVNAGVLDQLGAAPPAMCPMAAMENRSPSPGGIAGVGGASTTGGQSGWQRPRTLASGAHQSPQRRAFQGIL